MLCCEINTQNCQHVRAKLLDLSSILVCIAGICHSVNSSRVVLSHFRATRSIKSEANFVFGLIRADNVLGPGLQ